MNDKYYKEKADELYLASLGESTISGRKEVYEYHLRQVAKDAAIEAYRKGWQRCVELKGEENE